MLSGKSRSVQSFKKRNKTKRKKIALLKKQKEQPKQKKRQRKPRNKQREYFNRGIKQGFLIGLCLGLIYILFYSSVFKVKHLEIESTTGRAQLTYQETTQALIKPTTKHMLKQHTFLTLSTSWLGEELKKQHLQIKEVEIKKKFPNTLHLKITEEEPYITWQTKEALYNITQHGTVLPTTKTTTEIPHIIDSNNTTQYSPGERIAEPLFVTFVHDITSLMQKQTRLEIVKLSTPTAASREIHIETRQGLKILFDTAQDPEHEIAALNKLVAEKLTKEELANIDYIDLRIAEKAFFKFK